MAQIVIPDALLREIGQLIAPSVSATDFVVEAVREKLKADRRKQDFYRLSETTRAAIAQSGLSEADLLSEFEATR